MPISQRQLAASLRTATHIAERYAIAAFVGDNATQSAPNPFPNTTAGAVHQVWRQRAMEFRAFDIEVAGIACLLRAVSGLGGDETLMQEILRAGSHTANVFHGGDGCWIVGAVLYGKPSVSLPIIPKSKSRRGRYSSPSSNHCTSGQLDLFACIKTEFKSTNTFI
ncbi:hypothetical protein, partial [Methylobacterium sp. WL2]|uniref:hypothetical protein n=1 Tax=Methylobacterium sp. WL2 TaxID=2603902 RepID=UPI001AED12C9